MDYSTSDSDTQFNNSDVNFDNNEQISENNNQDDLLKQDSTEGLVHKVDSSFACDLKTNSSPNIIKLFYNAIERNDLQTARKMIRDNTEIQKLDPKKLNKQFPLENYKFTSRNGILVIYSTKAELNKQTVTQRQNKLDDSFDEFRSEMHEMNKSITNELNGLINKFCKICSRIALIEQKNESNEQRLNSHANVINQLVHIVNDNIICTQSEYKRNTRLI